jgi:hypothetical protein
MPFFWQQLFVFGRGGGLALPVIFLLPGGRVTARTAYDGKLEPWLLRALTVISYIVYGVRRCMATLRSEAWTWNVLRNTVRLDVSELERGAFAAFLTLTWTLCGVTILELMFWSSDPLPLNGELSNDFNMVTLTAYSLMEAAFCCGVSHVTLSSLSESTSTWTPTGWLGSNSANHTYHQQTLLNTLYPGTGSFK